MNPAEIALKNRSTTVVFTMVVVVGGIFCYFHLGRLENPDFVIKTRRPSMISAPTLANTIDPMG